MDRPTLEAKHWVLSFEELLDAGLSARQIEERVGTGILWPKFRGVFAVGRPQLNWEGNCRAAWLACGPDSAISHISSAREWSFRRSTGRIHISVPRSRAGHDGLIIHRPRSLPFDDVVEREGFAVTSVARTVLDMAPGQHADTVAKWMHEADVAGALDLVDLWRCMERSPRHRGRRIVEAALAIEVPATKSGLEDLLVPIVRSAGLPMPLFNRFLWSGGRLEEVDAHWPDLGLIVEVDSLKYHSSNWRKRRDREKADRLRALQWRVWRIPELAITLDPSGTARHLASLGRSKPRHAGFGQPTA